MGQPPGAVTGRTTIRDTGSRALYRGGCRRAKPHLTGPRAPSILPGVIVRARRLLLVVLLALGPLAVALPADRGAAVAQVALSPPRPRADDVEVLRRAARAAPTDPVGWRAYGLALMARDTVEDRIRARRVLEHAVNLSPQDIDLRIALADLYTRQNYLTLARRQLRAALANDAASGPAYTRLGRLALRDWLKFQRPGSLEAARRYWQDAARRGPTEPEPWLGLGVLALLDGDVAGAVAAGREVRSKPRSLTTLQRGEAYLLEGAGSYGLGWPAAADSAFRAALPLLAGPIRDHMLDITPAATVEDTAAYGRLTDSGARSRFLATFWKSRDPDLTTSWNELQLEFLSRGALAYFLFYDAKFRSWDVRGNFFVRYGPPDSTDYNPPNTTAGPLSYQPMTMNRLIWHYRALGFGVLFEEQYLNQRYDVPWSQESEIDFSPRPDSLDRRIAEGSTTTAGRGTFRTVLPNRIRLEGVVQAALFRRVAGFDPRTSTAPAMLMGGGVGPQGRLELYVAVLGGEAANLLSLDAVVLRDVTFEEVARAHTKRYAWCRSDSVQVAQFNFDLPAGDFVVGIAANDSIRGAAGTWRLQVRVPPNVPGRIELSDLELACARGEGPPDDPFAKLDGTIVPDPQRRVSRDQPFGVYFEIYNLVTDAAGRSRFSFEYEVRSTRKDGRPFFLKAVNPRRNDPIVSVERSDAVEGRARFQYVTANLAEQAPGPYRIEVAVVDSLTGFRTVRGLDFELVR